MRGGIVDWLERLGYDTESRRTVVSSSSTTEKLSLSIQQEMGTFFESGKDKAEKREGWAPLTPLPLRLLHYEKRK